MGTNSSLAGEAQFTPWQLSVGKLLAIAGLMVVMAAVVVGIVFANIVAGYYANPKDVRDAAAAGTEVLADQGTIAAVKAWLAPLKFVGLSTILTGIGVVLWGVVLTLRVRATVFSTAIPQPTRGGYGAEV